MHTEGRFPQKPLRCIRARTHAQREGSVANIKITEMWKFETTKASSTY